MSWSEHSRSEVLVAMERIEQLAARIRRDMEAGELHPGDCLRLVQGFDPSVLRALSAAEWDA